MIAILFIFFYILFPSSWCSLSNALIYFDNIVRSLQRALDRRLYLLLFGNTYGVPSQNPVWHFPEKVYNNEETLRKVISGINFICDDAK